MPHFMVFEIWHKGEVPRGQLETGVTSIAAFHADSGEEACQAAAKKTKKLTTYFAVEGTPWGVDMLEVEGTRELGAEDDLQESEKDRRLRELERRVLDRDVPLD